MCVSIQTSPPFLPRCLPMFLEPCALIHRGAPAASSTQLGTSQAPISHYLSLSGCLKDTISPYSSINIHLPSSHLSIYLSNYRSIRLSVYLSIYPSIYLSIPSIYLSNYLSHTQSLSVSSLFPSLSLSLSLCAGKS